MVKFMNISESISKIIKYNKKGELENASKIFKDLKKKFPLNPRLNKLQESIFNKIDPQQKEYLLSLYNSKKFIQLKNECISLNKILPDDILLYNLLGLSYLNLKQIDNSINIFMEGLKINPYDYDLLNNLSNAFYLNEDFSKSINILENLIASNKGDANTFYNLGVAYEKLYDFKKSILNYKSAINLDLKNPVYHENLGLVLFKIGDYCNSKSYLQKAISFKKNLKSSYNTLGLIEIHNKNYVKSIKYLNLDLYYNKNNSKAYILLGLAYVNLNKLNEAFNFFAKGLRLDRDNKENYKIITKCVKNIKFLNFNVQIEDILSRILEYKNLTRPYQLLTPVISMIKTYNSYKYLNNSDMSLQTINYGKFNDLLYSKLFQNILKSCLISDLGIEKIIKKLRFFLLFNNINDENLTDLKICISIQSHLNEYIFLENKNEKIKLDLLEKKIEEDLKNNNKLFEKHILILSMYRPIHNYDWSKIWNPEYKLKYLHNLLIGSFDKQKQNQKNITKLEMNNNFITSKVREQYEQNPYPRWIHTLINENPQRIEKFISKIKLLKYDEINKIEKPKILIAGCGTGQSTISYATNFFNCSVDALDISFNSLSYAQNKAIEYGIKNINFLQGNILNIDQLQRKYDVIECSGVLHHMDDPILGWKSLVDVLSENGILKIGLYSKKARSHITKLKEIIKLLNLKNQDTDIKEFRQKIIENKYPELNKITKSFDFYSTSNLRDLLFNVNEFHFNLLQIKDILKELNLKFLGFEFSNDNIFENFNSYFSTNNYNDYNSLELWNDYEIKNPNTFKGMYQFWVSKI